MAEPPVSEKVKEHPKTVVPCDEPKVKPKDHVVGIKLIVLLMSLTLVLFMALLDTSILGTAIPQITTEFHSITDIGWYVGAYTLASATLQPLSGKLYTEFSTKYTYLFFIFFFELGSLICGVAPSSLCFILGRAVAGIGMSGIANGSLTILGSCAPPQKSPLYLGIMMGFAQMGIAIGPLVGGALTQHVTWRWCFYINLPVGGLAGVIIALLHVPEVKQKDAFSFALLRKTIPKLDLPGFALFIPPSIMFLLALQFGSGGEYAWNSATIIGLFCGAGVALIIFVLWERHMGPRAMLPGNIFGQRVVWTSAMFGLCNISCALVTSNWMPTYFQAVKGNSPTTSGVHVLPGILGQLLLVVVSGALISRLGYYLPWAVGGAIAMAVGNGLLSTFTPTTSVAKWVVFQMIQGASRGASLQTGLVAVQNSVSREDLAVAMAILMLVQNLGTSISIVISNTIFAQTLIRRIPEYAPSVTAQQALDAGSGSAAVRNLVVGHEGELDGVLLAYSEGLRNIFYFLVGLSGLALLASSGMGWVDVRKKKAAKPESVVADGSKAGEA